MCVAEPPAKLTWYLPNGDPLLHNGDNIVFDTSEKNRASLMLKNVSRDMSGMFRCGVELATNIREAILVTKLTLPVSGVWRRTPAARTSTRCGWTSWRPPPGPAVPSRSTR